MFKALLLGQWHSLSDPALEEALRVRLDFMVCTGLETPEEVPDETTLCRFRNILIKKGLDQILFQAINQQLEELGLKIKKAEGAVLDATIIDSAARPRKMVETCKEGEKEKKEAKVLIHHSADPDARWLLKGKRFYFGYKGFVVADTEKGFTGAVHVTAANCAECKEFSVMLPRVKGNQLLADKAYASEENRSLLKKQGFKDGIMHKAVRGKPLSFSKKLFNKLISMKRFIIEQNFGTLKRGFRMERASYMTRLKVEGQLRLKAICFNLLKAVNMVEFS